MASMGEERRERERDSPVRRRQHHLRSKNGCVTCKERHIRCDERFPFCRNCVRVGRACVYTKTSTPPSSASPEPERLLNTGPSRPLLRQTHQAYGVSALYENTLTDLKPWKQDISNIAFWIVQQSRQLSISDQLQQAPQLLVPPIDVLGYNQLAQTHACVQSALTGFQAYIQYQTSKTATARELYLSQSCLALTKLQNEVNKFSLGNADAIVIASLILAAQAQDWEQWLIFMEGYSSALKQIKQRTTQTIYPDLLGENLPPQHNPPPTNIPTLPPPRSLEAMHHQIQEILTTIRATTPLISTENWHHTGFHDLEQLALTLTDAIQLHSPLEIYEKLAWMRSWMFWVEVRESEGDEGVVLRCYFYALLVVVGPLFPGRYEEGLRMRCGERMEGMMAEMDEGGPLVFGLVGVLGLVKGVVGRT